MLLGSFSVDTFLEEYWQKKPLLIRNALPDFSDPLSPEELAGLACEEGVESRIVSKTTSKKVSRTAPTDDDGWTLRNGPFVESDFTSLPDHYWTLLVQAVDHWFPDVKKLTKIVDFIPRWRIDDVMVSYAEKGAGIGPHFDYYDVFIVQGKGSRTWCIGQPCDSQSELVNDSGLKILKHFEKQEEWQLNSGDVLYIPPGLAHQGISLDSSLSYSIGFRAPSTAEVLLAYSDEICSDLNDDERFVDPKPQKPLSEGEINSSTLNKVEEMIIASLKNNEALPGWFGKYMTEPKHEDSLPVPEETISTQELLLTLADGELLFRHPASRFAFITTQDTLTLFADGEAFPFRSASALIQALSKLLNASNDDKPLDLARYLDDTEAVNLLSQLYNQGSLVFFDEQERS
jgi:50S ribosomal protein L16 3-hydroxylase